MTVVWVALGLVVLLALLVIVSYNRFVSQRNLIRNSWANIDTELKRRYDLIPNLLETVKGYAAHERETLEAVVRARSAAAAATGSPAEQAAAEGPLIGALRQLFALSERYPDLKANQNFLELQAELTNTEDRLQASRRFYNANVEQYNRRVQAFPSNVIAGLFKFTNEQFFEIEPAMRETMEQPPKVEFWGRVDFELPADVTALLRRVDEFIEAEIKPLEEQDDNARFFDHRREFARTDVDRGGVPRAEWYALLGEMRRRADAAGLYRWGLPSELGGLNGSNLGMAVVREHLAAKGLGLHNDLQNEASIIGNHPVVLMVWHAGTDEQKQWCERMLVGEMRVAFGLTEPDHGSDATWLETTGERDGDDWVLNGQKRFNTGMDVATHDLVFARTSGQQGEANGITCFVVPTSVAGLSVDFMWWTFNMPSEHAEVTLRDVRVPGAAILGDEGRGLELASMFVHENRIRQAASSLGAAQFCVDQAVAYAKERVVFGKPLWRNQAIQFPLAEMQTRCEMVRGLVHKAAWHLDRDEHMAVSDKVSMANYQANRLVCEAADLAIQVHGGMGYTRHKPFEHIYRHHRRYRITEGSEEIQIRRVAQRMFGVDVKRPT